MDNRLFVDTWGWLTLHDKGEQKHQEAVDFYQSFRSNKGLIYTTDYVLDETFTLLFKRLNAYQAKRSLEILVEAAQLNKINLIFINQTRFTQTQALRLKYIDKPYIYLDLNYRNVYRIIKDQYCFLNCRLQNL